MAKEIASEIQNKPVFGVDGVYDFSQKKEKNSDDVFLKKDVRLFCLKKTPNYTEREVKEILDSYKWPRGYELCPKHFKKRHEESLCFEHLSVLSEKKKTISLISVRDSFLEKNKETLDGKFIPLDTLVFLDLARTAFDLRPPNFVKSTFSSKKVFMSSHNAIFDSYDLPRIRPSYIFISEKRVFEKRHDVQIFDQAAFTLPHLINAKVIYKLGLIAN